MIEIIVPSSSVPGWSRNTANAGTFARVSSFFIASAKIGVSVIVSRT